MGAKKEKRASYHQGVRVTRLLDPFSPQVFLFLREVNFLMNVFGLVQVNRRRVL